MLDTVREIFGGSPADSEDVHECRRCGTTVETTTTSCPACGSEDIVVHSTT
ncbi:hypothetical protein C479_01001 [Halovivax asiaticus JCM 14624]|uniref:Small CPxCG-related zinc finger protein n=2 Tax=Halovivax asiaticus TaxID=332953 RepID=M0BSR4_9EURY|nr:hypothetical protein C479_01001 [Halovivax asiaticus JCM 14624]